VEDRYRNSADISFNKKCTFEDIINEIIYGSVKREDVLHLYELVDVDIKSYLEIGSYVGVSFNLLNKLFNPTFSVSVDPNIPHRIFKRPRDIFKELNANMSSRIQMIDSFWHSGGNPCIKSDYFSDLRFDLIFIDGNHNYDQVSGDFFEAINLLSKNGLILLHDVYTWNDVNRFVRKLMSDKNFSVKLSPKKTSIDGFAAVQRLTQN
jgi:predicted O-methyltransferase YrrM